MIWTGRIRGRRMTAGHAWEQIKFTAPDAGEFYQTVSVTEEAFLLFSLSVWFLLFLLLRKKKQEKWDKENPNANESSKTISFSETPPFSFSFIMKRRLKIHSKTSGRPMVAPTLWFFMYHLVGNLPKPFVFTIPPSFSFGKCHLPLHKGGLRLLFIYNEKEIKKSSTWSLFTPHATVDFMFFTIPPSFSFGKCHLPLHKGGLQVRAFTKKHIF